MPKQPNPRPGDLFIDRYMPGASAEEREAAYTNVRRLIAVLVRIDERLRREGEKADSPESDSYDRFKEPDNPGIV
jgi:hypothetical protein